MMAPVVRTGFNEIHYDTGTALDDPAAGRSSLLSEAELQAARDPIGYLQRLDASPSRRWSCFMPDPWPGGRWGAIPTPCWTTPVPAPWPPPAMKPPDCWISGCSRRPSPWIPKNRTGPLRRWRCCNPRSATGACPAVGWHALNGLALYRTQQLSAAIAELKTAFRLKQAAPDSHRQPAGCARLLMTLGNLYADLSLPGRPNPIIWRPSDAWCC